MLPRLLLVGRDADRLAAVARAHSVADWTTDLDAALSDPGYAIFFDAAATQQRVGTLEQAIAAGKHIYSEKPVAPTAAQGLALLQQAAGARAQARRGRGQGPSARTGEARRAHASGALGRIVGFRLEFGWWVFDGSDRPVPAAELELPRAAAAA